MHCKVGVCTEIYLHTFIWITNNFFLWMHLLFLFAKKNVNSFFFTYLYEICPTFVSIKTISNLLRKVANSKILYLFNLFNLIRQISGNFIYLYVILITKTHFHSHKRNNRSVKRFFSLLKHKYTKHSNLFSYLKLTITIKRKKKNAFFPFKQKRKRIIIMARN